MKRVKLFVLAILSCCMVIGLSGCRAEDLKYKTSGADSFVWLHDGREYIIVDTESKKSFEFTIDSGDHYIMLKGEDFSGSLHLEVR